MGLYLESRELHFGVAVHESPRRRRCSPAGVYWICTPLGGDTEGVKVVFKDGRLAPGQSLIRRPESPSGFTRRQETSGVPMGAFRPCPAGRDGGDR
jgi:hypothetical protein